MEGSLSKAKRRFVANITTNLMSVCVDTSVAIWQTPYLIGYLGVAAYGLIPLAMSFIAYFNLATASIAMATSRFVAIHLTKGQIREGNVYFNSSLVALVVICTALTS